KKFHIRTYVLAVGALKVYVYKPMLALFAAKPYSAPGSSSSAFSPSDQTPESQGDPSPSSTTAEREPHNDTGTHIPTDVNADLTGHLSNTCFHLDPSTRESSVHAFWSLPSSLPPTTTSTSSSSPPNPEPSPNQEDWKESLFAQIQSITAQTFLAAARTMSIHFQPLPNAFEIFGVDFLVDGKGRRG
ncbi:hypothetical protein KC324_g19451, partial [Hortaea werneckii]